MNKDTQSLLELRKFVAPEFIFGLGARKLVGRYAKNCGARKVLLVTDKFLREHTHWIQEMRQLLTAAGLESVLFDHITPNPRSEEAMEGAKLFQQENCNAIVAIGGGSVMDCAKGINFVYTNGGKIADYWGVGKAARIRVSSFTAPFLIGTLKSTRTRTRLPFTSMSRIVFLSMVNPL